MTFVPVKPNVDDYWDSEKHAHLLNFNAMAKLPEPYTYTNDTPKLIDQCIDTAFAVKAARTNENVPDEETARLAPDFYFPRAPGVAANPRSWAHFVAKDAPKDIQHIVLDYCAKEYKRRYWGASAPTHFHQGVVGTDMLCSYLPYKVNATTFLVKWTNKVPRPEQVIQDALRGKIEASERQIDLIRQSVDCSAVLEDRENFTLFRGATPGHCSFVAMHASAAEMAILLAWFLYVIPPEDMLHVKALARGAVFGRQYLGVHTQQDNWGGMILGDHIARDELIAYGTQLPGASTAEKIKEHLDEVIPLAA